VAGRRALQGSLPLAQGLVVLKAGVTRTPREIVAELVPRLPKTRSGKLLRGTMRQIADGEPHKVPSTIDDPAILDEVKAVLRDLGYAREPKGEIGG